MAPAIAQDNLTELLRAHVHGDKTAGDVLLPMIQAELRRLARNRLRMERPNHTWQTTDVVNEAWAKLFGGKPVDLADRAHFFALAALNMRRILVEHARKRLVQVHGHGEAVPVEVLESRQMSMGTEASWVHVIAIHEALDRLAVLHPKRAKVIEMQFFAEMTDVAIAEVLGIATKTVGKYGDFARTWLRQQIAPVPREHSEK